MTATYTVRFRCYYTANYTQHYTTLKLKEIPKWIEAYQFTHPDVKHINVSIWIEGDTKD